MLDRYCSACKNFFDSSNFYKDKRVKDGLTRKCKTCHAKKSYESRKKRPEFESERYDYTRTRLLAKYGLTKESYELLVEQQNSKCAICKNTTKSWYGNNKHGYLYVDHDHNTSKVRGLLCYNCNIGLGHFKDSIANLEIAIKYLGAVC